MNNNIRTEDGLILSDILIPEDILNRWQEIVDIAADIMNSSSAMLMRYRPPEIEVLRLSKSGDSPFKEGNMLNSAGTLFERVINSEGKVLIPNLSEQEEQAREICSGLKIISFMGLPLLWHSGKVFGLICVLDSKENLYSNSHQNLLLHFKYEIECNLQKIFNEHIAKGGLMQILSGDSQSGFESKYRLLADYSSDLIWTTNAEFQTTYVSPSSKQLLGYTPDELMSRSLKKLLTPSSFERTIETYKKTVEHLAADEQYRQKPVEVEYIKKDCSTIWAEVSINLLKDSRGQFRGIIGISRDITERKKTEKLFRESEEKFRALAENSFDTIMRFDCNCKLLYVNPIVEKHTGIPAHKYIGKTHTELGFPEKLVDLWERTIKQVFSTGMADRIDFQFNENLWLDWSLIPEFSRDSKVQAVITFARDITKRKIIEEELFRSEEKYRTILESIEDGYYEVDITGNFVFFNTAMYKMVGYTRDELIGMNNRQIMDKDTASKVFKTFNRIYRTGKPDKAFGWMLLRKDKSKIYVETSITPIFDSANQAIGYRGICRDITERIEAEQALRRSEEKYRTILESIEDSYYEVDLSGNFTFFNEALCKMIGYSGDEVMGMNNRAYATPETAKRIFKFYNEVFRTGDSAKILDYEIIRKDGSSLNTEMSVSLMRDSSGKPIGFRGIARDVTERKRMEEELLKTKKIDSIGILAGGIAHDFNNILTAILGNISLAKLDLSEDDELYDTLLEAENASLRAKDLTRQLLTFSKGGAPIKITASISELLIETTDFVLSGSKSKCEYSIPEDLRNVDIDLGQISQVIHNLILNSRQSMPEGGTITLSAGNVTVKKKDKLPIGNGDYIKIIIADQGKGIAEEDLPNIFDPYFTTKDMGTGLGLTLTYSIVANHGGHISAASVEGKGTTFTIYIPASKEKIIKVELEQITETIDSGKILLMDDEEMILDVGEKMLHQLGFDVILSHSGEEAVELYKKAKGSKEPFDLVIMDLTIPGKLGGKDAIAMLKKFDPDVRAIVSSGYSNDPVLANYKDYGFAGIITKPYKVENLRDVLQRVLNQ